MSKLEVMTVEKAIGRAAWNMTRKRDTKDAAAIDVLAAEVERLRAENAEILKRLGLGKDQDKQRVIDQLVELDWFRRRENEILQASLAWLDKLTRSHLESWLKRNPKPGAGE